MIFTYVVCGRPAIKWWFLINQLSARFVDQNGDTYIVVIIIIRHSLRVNVSEIRIIWDEISRLQRRTNEEVRTNHYGRKTDCGRTNREAKVKVVLTRIKIASRSITRFNVNPNWSFHILKTYWIPIFTRNWIRYNYVRNRSTELYTTFEWASISWIKNQRC